ncbi:MAG: tRNA preQ1(34) S-adenosylmethionine ribosyltransferase-isomerase QueA [Ruminococcaceae bacterium]|nr:tRNA preQ1(34) S-adenosylmethionine ribosyltransferase-isomerase QueA [Oscillospiraceae bacterium]
MITNERIKTELKKSDFFYDLPEELIAQTPAEKRDCSRLMVLNRQTGSIEHKHFYDIIDYLNPNDVLVVNNSKVIPARIFGTDAEKDDRVVEFLLLRRHGDRVWETLVRPGKKAKIGKKFIFGDGELVGEITDIVEEGNRLITFSLGGAEIYSALEKIGNMPLPPYITEKLEDKSRYQTVYAKTEGSAAAPTAGLHFTEELLDRIKQKGIAIVPVMLHVGLGTFRPVKEDDVKDHVMHSEYFSISKESADEINRRKANGGRVICVGTTSCRVLESVAKDDGTLSEMADDTAIFIYPGYKFKAVDALITNFHLPESTLLMLVSALYNREKMLEAYKTAVDEKYRFFSFGDAMFIE